MREREAPCSDLRHRAVWFSVTGSPVLSDLGRWFAAFLLVVTLGGLIASRQRRAPPRPDRSETANDACRGERAIRRCIGSGNANYRRAASGSWCRSVSWGSTLRAHMLVGVLCIMDAIVFATHSATATHTYRVRMTSVQRPFDILIATG